MNCTETDFDISYRSAANRHHAPALYNLGLCYESGLGVTVDEKMVRTFNLFASVSKMDAYLSS